MIPVRMLRLISGEEIIGKVFVKNSTFFVQDPLMAQLTSANKTWSFWDPLVVSLDRTLSLSEQHVLYDYEPAPEVVAYYEEYYIYVRDPENLHHRFEAIRTSTLELKKENKPETIN